MASTYRLPNGMVCVCDARPGAGTVSMLIAIKTGSADEADDEAGLTSLTHNVCMGGTTSLSRLEIAERIESKGASFNNSSDRTKTAFSGQFLAKDTAEILAIAADVIRNPAFDPDEIKKAQAQLALTIEQVEQQPVNRAGLKFMEAVFGNQGAGHNPLGSASLVNSFTPQQIRERHRTLLADPSRIVISFSGDIDSETAEQLAEKHFGDLKQAAPLSVPAFTFKGGDLREPTNDEQLTLRIGFSAPSLRDPQRHAVTLLRELLSGGMSSPLFQEIREKRGLVYNVGAQYEQHDHAGIFSIAAGTGRGNAGELITAAMELLGGIVENGFPQDEIDRARKRIIRSIQSQMESMGSACYRNALQIQNVGRLVSLEELEDKLSQITPDAIRAVCATMLSQGTYAFSGVGPQDTMPDEQEILALMQAQLKNAPSVAPAPPIDFLSTTATAFQNAGTRNVAKASPAQMSVLPNGMIVVTAERPGSLSCGAWVGVGSDSESEEMNGATHMNEHMMFKGTPSFGPGVIDQIVEQDLLGGLNAYTSKDRTAYYFYNLAMEDLEKTVDICGEMVFQANLDQTEFAGQTTAPDGSLIIIKGERDVVIEEIKMYDGRIRSRQSELLMQTAYPDQAHGRPILGTEATLNAMDAAKLAQYRDAFYVPNNVVFSAAGPVRHADFVALITRKFGHLPRVPVAPMPVPSYQGGTAFIEMDSAQLCQMTLACEGVGETDADDHAFSLLSGILGRGESSRLYKAVVDDRQLTNAIGAYHQSFRNCGLMGISLSVRPENVREVTKVIYSEIRDLVQTLSEEELDKVKTQMEMAIHKRVETNRDACDTYGNDALVYGYPLDAAALLTAINAVSVEDIKRLAGKILDSNPTLALVVPKGTDPTLIPTHDEVLELQLPPAKTPRAAASTSGAASL